MNNESIEQKTMHYIGLYHELRKHMKWKVTDTRILMAIASLYVMHNKPFNMNRLLMVTDQIKKKATMFSPMKSQPRFTTGALLDINFEQPEKQVDLLFNYYDIFRKEKFKASVFTYISASIIITNQHNNSNIHGVIRKAKDIYDGMKHEHSFLTSDSDYPLATLLAFESENRDNLIQRMEYFYDGLHKNGFRKGNDLQFLSHILSLGRDTSVDTLISRSIHIFDHFKGSGIKPKPTHYPIIGMLSLLPESEVDMKSIQQIYKRLNGEKHFKWQKDTNLMVAVGFSVKEKLTHTQLAETNIHTTIEMVIQAQQAVMIAVAATASMNAINNSNHS